jgi:ribosome biogenesis GTPase A
MTKARRDLAALIPSQDLIIEVVDARMPVASANPLITELRGSIPCLKILTRCDLADASVTAAWLRWFADAGDPAVTAFAATTLQVTDIRRRFADALRQRGLASSPGRPVRALITGVPNVGKSTLLNTLVERVVAKVGDKPAVTKVQQHVALASGTIITDSPGLLWPKIEDERVAMRLALAGSIPDTAIDYTIIAGFGALLLRDRHPDLLQARFKLASLADDGVTILRDIGRRRGCLLPGGAIDLHRAAELLVHEFRAGTIGRISLESPTASLAVDD